MQTVQRLAAARRAWKRDPKRERYKEWEFGYFRAALRRLGPDILFSNFVLIKNRFEFISNFDDKHLVRCHIRIEFHPNTRVLDPVLRR